MTSSSGTSSLLPRKLVSRRYMRITRSLSTLPRNELISCRRSVSVSGRKSIRPSPFQNRNSLLPQGRLSASCSSTWVALGRELGQQEINAPVDLACIVGIGLEVFSAAHQDVT